jgi:YHS domain-containing protein
MEGDDYIGHCVNVAARLCDLAGSGEALASLSVLDSLPRWGQAVTHRDVTLRGVEKPVTATSIGMPTAGPGFHLDPICGVPISAATAEATAEDHRGKTVLFCSPGCLDTWQRRPIPSRGAPDVLSAGG